MYSSHAVVSIARAQIGGCLRRICDGARIGSEQPWVADGTWHYRNVERPLRRRIFDHCRDLTRWDCLIRDNAPFSPPQEPSEALADDDLRTVIDLRRVEELEMAPNNRD